MKLKTEDGVFNLKFEPSRYKTEAGAAKAFFKALCILARDLGYPDGEVILQNPERSKECGYGNNWRVSWEGGLYGWGVSASLNGLCSDSWYTEPYYSFDVCFVSA